MKWITPLSSDPVGRSEKVAKTKLRVFGVTLLHLVSVLAVLYLVYAEIHDFQELLGPRLGALLAISLGAFLLPLYGVLPTFMYLYAIHRLLRMLKEKDLQNTPPEKVSTLPNEAAGHDARCNTA